MAQRAQKMAAMADKINQAYSLLQTDREESNRKKVKMQHVRELGRLLELFSNEFGGGLITADLAGMLAFPKRYALKCKKVWVDNLETFSPKVQRTAEQIAATKAKYHDRKHTERYKAARLASRDSRNAKKKEYHLKKKAEKEQVLLALHNAHVTAWKEAKGAARKRADGRRRNRGAIGKMRKALAHDWFYHALGAKYCNRCKTLLPVGEFHNLHNGAFGLNSICKQCNTEVIRERSRTDAFFRFKRNIRTRVYLGLRNGGWVKDGPTAGIVGCDYATLCKHIERQFTRGMTWEKMGQEIHIDHIIPLSSAKTEEEVRRLMHFTNLRPLWAKDNLRKSARVETLL